MSTTAAPPTRSPNPEAARASRLLDRFSVLLVAFAALLWASDVFFRTGLIQRGLTSNQIVLGEDFLITLAFLPVLPRILPELRRMRGISWLAMALIAAGPQALATVLFTESFSISFKAGASNETYLLQQLQPFIAVTLAWLVLKERRRPYFWPLAAVTVGAVYIVVFAQAPLAPWSDVEHGRLVAGVLALGAASLWAAGTVLGRYALQELSFMTTTALRFWLALPVLVVIAFVRDGSGALGHYSAAELPAFLGIALLPGFVALLLYYRALRSTPASLATLAETAYPVTVTLLLALPAPYGFAQKIAPLQLVGSAVLVAVMVTLNFGKERDVVQEPRPHTLELALER